MMYNPIAKMVKNHFRGDKDAIVMWLRTPNIAFEGKSPNEMLENGHFYQVWRFCSANLKGKTYVRPDLTEKDHTENGFQD